VPATGDAQLPAGRLHAAQVDAAPAACGMHAACVQSAQPPVAPLGERTESSASVLAPGQPPAPVTDALFGGGTDCRSSARVTQAGYEAGWSAETSDYDGLLRARALEIAQAACVRALGHAHDLQPELIAQFVEDALAAAGHPRDATIYLRPQDAFNGSGQQPHAVVADGALQAGEVRIETPLGSLAATFAQRAEALCSAAACN
jgi:hypothetical protein